MLKIKFIISKLALAFLKKDFVFVNEFEEGYTNLFNEFFERFYAAIKQRQYFVYSILDDLL